MTDNMNYFKTFCRISKAFGTIRNTESLLELIVSSAMETMQGKAACLFLEDAEKKFYIPVCQKGLSDRYLHSSPQRGKAILDDMLKTGYFAMTDALDDARAENREAKRKENIASILAVPVIVSGKPIGVLTLYTATRREFTEDEIEFLGALAEQGGIAIQNARLLERIKKNAILFHDLADSINSTHLDVKKIFHILTADIAEAFGMKGVLVRLLNKETGTLDLVASYGFSEKYLSKGPLAADKGIAREALEGKTVIIRDVRKDDRIQYPKEMREEGIVSMLSAPIQSGDEVIGVMRLCSDAERDFPEDMVILVEALAHQGGIAIQNASLYLSLQEDKQNLEKDIWSHRLWF